MIILKITLDLLPGKQKEVMQTLLSLMEVSKNEKGCLSYEIFIHIESKNVLNLMEEWKTRQDLERHIRSGRFSVLLGTKSLMARPLEMKIHTVAHSEGAELVDALRGK